MEEVINKLRTVLFSMKIETEVVREELCDPAIDLIGKAYHIQIGYYGGKLRMWLNKEICDKTGELQAVEFGDEYHNVEEFINHLKYKLS